ncbi:uncharacterized protein CEXT_786761 [Caerostris extrusa]|uniref:Uncharacterized protein n=1 Tax=Caerostris extrusa TaxID=172846 RepID=A0AAV4M7Y5_CAEEX|nr:uncharacterized protein CEXT_786761 [Caerostris extrusa]
MKAYIHQRANPSEKSHEISHIHDKLSVTVEKTVGGKKSAVAHLHVDHNRTFTGELHYLRFHGQFEIYTDFAAFYLPGPNEFKYGGESYGKQKGLVLGSLHFGHSTEPYMIGKILLDYKSLEEKLNKELYPKLSHKHFLPEMHEQCLRDVKDGKSHTPACLSAIREYTIYNRWRIHLTWQKELPQGFKMLCTT